MSVSLPGPVQAVFDATNAGDTAAFLAAFAEDGVIDDWGREFRGHAAIQRWSDGENIGVQATWAPTEVADARRRARGDRHGGRQRLQRPQPLHLPYGRRTRHPDDDPRLTRARPWARDAAPVAGPPRAGPPPR